MWTEFWMFVGLCYWTPEKRSNIGNWTNLAWIPILCHVSFPKIWVRSEICDTVLLPNTINEKVPNALQIAENDICVIDWYRHNYMKECSKLNSTANVELIGIKWYATTFPWLIKYDKVFLEIIVSISKIFQNTWQITLLLWKNSAICWMLCNPRAVQVDMSH